MLKYENVSFQIKYMEAMWELLWFEITNMLIAVYEKNKYIVLCIIFFGTLSLPEMLTPSAPAYQAQEIK